MSCSVGQLPRSAHGGSLSGPAHLITARVCGGTAAPGPTRLQQFDFAGRSCGIPARRDVLFHRTSAATCKACPSFGLTAFREMIGSRLPVEAPVAFASHPTCRIGPSRSDVARRRYTVKRGNNCPCSLRRIIQKSNTGVTLSHKPSVAMHRALEKRREQCATPIASARGASTTRAPRTIARTIACGARLQTRQRSKRDLSGRPQRARACACVQNGAGAHRPGSVTPKRSAPIIRSRPPMPDSRRE